MQFSAIIVTLMASLAIASPANPIDIRGGGGGGGSGGKTVTITTTGSGGKTVTVTTTTTTSSVSTATGSTGSGSGGSSYIPCTSTLYSNPECCATDVLGVADLNCETVPQTPSSAANFASICSASGLTARCCVLPILGQSVLCETPVGL